MSFFLYVKLTDSNSVLAHNNYGTFILNFFQSIFELFTCYQLK